MKILITLLFLLVGQITAIAQTPIIDSKVKYKDLREVKWLTDNKIENNRMTIIEFYLDGNPSCRKIMDSVLIPIHEKNPDIQIIILAFKESEKLNHIAQQYPSLNVGIDKQGSVFRRFGIKYVPASVLIGENDKIMWKGALNKTFHLF